MKDMNQGHYCEYGKKILTIPKPFHPKYTEMKDEKDNYCDQRMKYAKQTQLVFNVLRTVPTIVTAHTFCASRDTRVSYGWCLLIQEYFLRGLKLYGESRT